MSSCILRWIGAAACLLQLSGCLNPAFVSQLSGGGVVPLAPGGQPLVQLLVINATATATIDIRMGWTPVSLERNSTYQLGISPREQRGRLLLCPIDQIGLGDPDDLTAPAIVTYDNEVTTNVPASAFPLVLKAGTDYECGDTVVFTIIDDPTNGYRIRVLPGRVEGSEQTGPFSGPDTFEIVKQLLVANGVTLPESP